LLFPEGIYIHKGEKVYTPTISPIYSLISMKKGTKKSQNSLMVEYIGKNWHQIYQELIRWKEIIGSDWDRVKRVYIT
jgi:hypothetical protein